MLGSALSWKPKPSLACWCWTGAPNESKEPDRMWAAEQEALGPGAPGLGGLSALSQPIPEPCSPGKGHIL